MLVNKFYVSIILLILAGCSTNVPASSPTNTATLIPSSISNSAQYIKLPPGPSSGFPDNRDLFSLYQRFSGGKDLSGYMQNREESKPPLRSLGDLDSFWVSDLVHNKVYEVSAELAYISDHAYWFFEKDSLPSLSTLEFIAETFESSIYPKLTQTLGHEWTPGIDNDVHIYILHTQINGVAGYYSMSDEYPREISRYSNEYEILYIDPSSARLGSTFYFELLIHEFQHAIHWAQDPNEETWINEGLSEVAKNITGYNLSFVDNFESNPQTSLINWPHDDSDSLPHYGASSLFIEYLSQYFGGYNNLKVLIKSQPDGIDGINNFLTESGYSKRFYDVFGDWIVANYLDSFAVHPYYYDNLNLTLGSSILSVNEQHSATLPQFSADYIELSSSTEPFYLHFNGTETNRILPHSDQPDNHCWWGNKGDSIDSTLTTTVDLSDVMTANLHFKAWYSIEESWDYAYVAISLDKGETWEIVNGSSSSSVNPLGRAYGPGYTGDSGGWLSEVVNLTPYVGSEILLRFEYITDESRHDIGLCIDDVSIPELDFFDSMDETDSVWLSRGFVRTKNTIPQSYLVQLIEIGSEVKVKTMPLDEFAKGTFLINPSQIVSKRVITVSPTSENTTLPASYSIFTTKY